MLPIDAVGVKPGLYRHYKGNSYRVLFVAIWSDNEFETPAPDSDVYVYPGSDVGHFKRSKISMFAATRSAEQEFAIIVAKWSGNPDGPVNKYDQPIVIYVALYGDGRVSARTVEEFEEQVQQPLDTFTRPRFEWIGP